MKYIITLFLLVTSLSSVLAATDEVPYWVLVGIMAQESRSYYATDAQGNETIVYVDRRTGAAGELSAFQITRIAWEQVRRPGDRFGDLARDQVYAERIAMDYLLWLYNGAAHRSWPHAVQMYNRGPGRLSYKYYANVAAKARKAGYQL
jgi:hypothetical protein